MTNSQHNRQTALLLTFMLVVGGVLVVAGGCQKPHRRQDTWAPQVEVPKRFRGLGAYAEQGKTPTGESEEARYRRAYKAFWWRCVELKAAKLDARCPWTCSGTPGATDGCSDGSDAAVDRIDRLVERAGAEQARQQLRQAVDSDAHRAACPAVESYFKQCSTGAKAAGH